MTPMMNEFTIWLVKIVERKREKANVNPVFDGGATDLENQIDTYMAGVDGTIPSVWAQHYKQFSNERDPEYTRYLELKKRFE